MRLPKMSLKNRLPAPSKAGPSRKLTPRRVDERRAWSKQFGRRTGSGKLWASSALATPVIAASARRPNTSEERTIIEADSLWSCVWRGRDRQERGRVRGYHDTERVRANLFPAMQVGGCSVRFRRLDLRRPGWPGSVLRPRRAPARPRRSLPGAEYRPRPPGGLHLQKRGRNPRSAACQPYASGLECPSDRRQKGNQVRGIDERRARARSSASRGRRRSARHDDQRDARRARRGAPLAGCAGGELASRWMASTPMAIPQSTGRCLIACPD